MRDNWTIAVDVSDEGGLLTARCVFNHANNVDNAYASMSSRQRFTLGDDCWKSLTD